MNTVHQHQADERDGQLTATDVAAADADGAKPQPPTRLILLVRHGETTFNVEGRLPGQLPGVPLTDEGRRQAHQAAMALAAMPLSAVISSPLDRARDTAEILARGWGLSVQLDDRLKDTDVRRWAGQKIADVAKDDPQWKAFLERPTEPPDGAESLADVQARSVAVVEDVRRTPELGKYIAIVAHADVVKLIVAHYAGIALHGARYLHVANASITALAFTGDEPPHVLALNWTPAPGWLVPPLPKPAEPPAAASANGAVAPTSAEHATTPSSET
jgi:broad specificity phosphatase PhoE